MSQEVKSQQNSELSPYEIITLKRDGEKLTEKQIKTFITDYSTGNIPDYQMSALLMAIYLKGMDPEETAALTQAMLKSGEELDFAGDLTSVDKHSTGGVGDKASFVLAPIASACGVKVPMMAGRGLGHTGGTIDKIESVPGFKAELELTEFLNMVQEHGLALTGQTKEIAPADKKIYALRDVTATVESIPLITASIMSKKLAEGALGIVMDVKTGSGAFMQKREDALALAKSLQKTAELAGRSFYYVISDMSQPLGHAIGNSLEMIESAECLKGEGPQDLEELSIHLAGAMIYLAGKAKSVEDGVGQAKIALSSGKALKEFREMIKRQGGSVDFIDRPDSLALASERTEVLADQDGHIEKINCKNLGLHCVKLGGGRRVQEDKIDHSVGLLFYKKIGQEVKKGDRIATIYHRKEQYDLVKKIEKDIVERDVQISNQKVEAPPLIYETGESLSQKRKELA